MILSLVVRGLRNQLSGSNGQLLDFCEIFAGAAWLTHEMLSGGFCGVAFDYVMNALHDVLNSSGLRLVLNAVCQFGSLDFVGWRHLVQASLCFAVASQGGCLKMAIWGRLMATTLSRQVTT